MAKQLDSYKRAQIIGHLEQGMSPEEVSSIFDVHRSTVIRTRQKYAEFKSFEHKGSNGRPKKLTNEVVTVVEDEIKKILKILCEK
jgi:transposase